jgi:hypothetical protein
MPVDNDLNAYLGHLERMVTRLQSDVTSMKVSGDKPVSLPGQYAGKPIPSRVGVEMNVAAASTARVQGNITIAADGPFCATSIHFAVRYVGGAASAEWRPISSVHDITNTGAFIPNFYWEYQVTGSHRDRQNIAVPSSLVDRAEEGNGFFDFSIQDVFAKTSTVTIWITPTINFDATQAAVVWAGFNGFYILE